MPTFFKKLVLAAVLMSSLLQLSFALLMQLHTGSMENCLTDNGCLFEGYAQETRAEPVPLMWTALPLLALCLTPLFLNKTLGVPALASVLPNLRSRLKGVVQRE